MDEQHEDKSDWFWAICDAKDGAVIWDASTMQACIYSCRNAAREMNRRMFPDEDHRIEKVRVNSYEKAVIS